MTFTYTSVNDNSSSVSPQLIESELISVGPSWRELVLTAALNGFFTALFLGLLWLMTR